MQFAPDRWVQGGGLRLRARQLSASAARTTIVLVHGFGDALEAWEGVAVALQNRARLVAFDLRGHGESEWPRDGDYSLASTVQDLAAVVADCAAPSVLLAGHSTGGMTALAYAATRPPSVAGLVLLDVDPFRFKDGLERLLAFAGPEVAPSFADFVAAQAASGDRRSRDEIAAWLRTRTRVNARGMWTWKQDPRLRPPRDVVPARPRTDVEVETMLQGVACPVLMVRGARSRACTAAGVARALASCRSPAAQAEIPRAGHALLAEAADAVARHLDEFSARLS